MQNYLALTENERDTIYKCLLVIKEAFEVLGQEDQKLTDFCKVEYQDVCVTYHKIRDMMFWDDRERRLQ